MSGNTTHQQNNNMVLFEDETIDREIPKCSINVTPPIPKKTHSFIKTFDKFGQFPREIQLKIFQDALPAPRIVYINFGIVRCVRLTANERAIYYSLDVYTAKLPGILPLLITCKASNASVHLDGGPLKKIEIKPLNRGRVLYEEKRYQKNFPVHVEHWDHTVCNYTYMRPSQDILLLRADKLLQLYKHGGSLNLEGITHIALQRIACMPMGDWAEIMGVQDEEQRMIELLDFIEAQCPNLRRLSLVPHHYKIYGGATTNSRLIDINSDLLKLDLRDENGDQGPKSAESWLYVNLSDLLKERNNIDRKTQIHREKIEKQGNKDSISYWKGVEIVNCLICRVRNIDGYPRLFIPILQAYVSCNDDGTLATPSEDIPERVVELRNTLSLIQSSNEMPSRIV